MLYLSILSIVSSIALFFLYRFTNAKLSEAMSDISWGQSVIYDIDYKIIRLFKGDLIDMGKRTLRKWEDFCKVLRNNKNTDAICRTAYV